MKIKQHARVALQSLLATFFVALAVVAVTQAATTIGNNVSTGTVTTTGIVDITASSDTPLTVNGDTSSTTLAVYQAGAGDIINVLDGQTEVFTILDGGKVGVGSSTPFSLLSVEALPGSNAIVVGSSSVELFKIDDSGAVSFNGGGWADADFTVQGDTLSNLVTVDASADSVGIASSTPWGLLAVEQGTETYSFIVMNTGSTTPAFVVSGTASGGGGRMVGVGSSTPSALFSIGEDAPGTSTSTMLALGFNNTTDGTTTVDLGRVCFRALTDGGTTLYWWFTGSPADQDSTSFLATSTTSCY